MSVDGAIKKKVSLMTNEEAIKVLKSKMDGSVDTSYEWAETVRLAIKALEQPEQKWIPCSKTVDIPDHEILACDKYGEEMFGYLGYEDDQWLCESDGCMMYDPIAWCEKPEPYKGE